jgi:lipopolysaccharide export system protein LptA
VSRWQRQARLGFGLFALIFAAILWFVIDERRPPAPARGVERLDPKAVSEIKGGDVVQVKGQTRDIRVEFATQVLYSDGSAKYTGFKAFIDDRGGRSFEIAGNEAHVAAQQSAFDVRGNVGLKTSDGLVAKTEQATFAEADGILRGPGPISFERARVTGTGVGFKYERSIDRLELLDRAVINVAPQGNAGGMAVRSGSAAHSRAERFLRFERGMHMERDGQVIVADTATVFMLADRDEPEVVELRGSASISGQGTMGSLQDMQARDMNLRYAPDGRTLQHVLLVGQSRLQLRRADGSAGQQLFADTTDVVLAADGAVTNLVGRDNVKVTIPPAPGASAREVTAQTVTGSGAAGRGLTAMLFENNVVYREDVPGSNPRVVRSRTLNAGLAEAGTIDTAHFTGGFAFDDGRMTAKSAEAAYNTAKGTLALRSPDPANLPNIKDERVDLNAVSIDVTLSPRRLDATEKVRAIFAAGRREGDRGTTLLNEDEAIVVLCDKLTFDETSGAGVYTGNARMLQDSGNQIRGDTIELNEKTGKLLATGSVITSLPLAAAKDSGAKGNSTGRAGQFEFDDAARRAVYTKQAQLDGAQGNLRADQIELLLAPQGNDLQQMTADGTVVIILDERTASGQRLVYHPTDERYVLNGNPVSLVQDCQETAGRTLTFYRASAKVQVDGQDKTRVTTKGGKCPAPPNLRSGNPRFPVHGDASH